MSLQQHPVDAAPRHRWRGAGADRWLSLAAAPTFALMALLSAMSGGGALEEFCTSSTPFGGMTAMYLLMTAFHSAPWLKLIGKALRTS